MTTQVPFGNARTAAYLMFALADVSDLMEAGRWTEAQAIVSLALAGGEQAALQGWQWPLAWMLTSLAEPPWAHIRRQPTPEDGRSLSRLADPGHMAAVVSYFRDLIAVGEAQRRVVTVRPGTAAGDAGDPDPRPAPAAKAPAKKGAGRGADP